MKPTLVLLIGTVALVGASATVGAADGPSAEPTWPDEQTAENNTTSVSPGQQLAGAIGAQGAAVEGALWNRTLAERLANATTAAERAEVVVDEVEMLEAYLDELEAARANLTDSWEDGELSEGEFRIALSEFVVRAHTVELRANQTARAAARLPERVREEYRVNVTHIRTLSERAHRLYQFEGAVAEDVVEETLENESDEQTLAYPGA